MPPLSESSTAHLFDGPALAVNDLAAAYQPRRVWAASVSIGWNLLIAVGFLASHGAWGLYLRLAALTAHNGVPHLAWLIPVYLAIVFAAHAFLNYPVDLWFGYLEERQFGLVKDGVRAWTRDWIAGVAQHGIFFILGSWGLLAIQAAAPATWLAWAAGSLLGLFLLTTYFSGDLLPSGLFHMEPVSEADRQKLAALIAPAALPRIAAYSAPQLRDFSGGLIGLGNRQVLLLSRSTLSAASNPLLRFVLLHEMGHRRYHHLLLATLAGWAWVAIGLCAGDAIITHFSRYAIGLPPYIVWLALTISVWMALGEPALAYLGRRLEYQADRFYLRNGGTIEEMRAALDELSRRNLARTEGLRRRHTIFHPLPSVWNRLHAARVYVARLSRIALSTEAG